MAHPDHFGGTAKEVLSWVQDTHVTMSPAENAAFKTPDGIDDMPPVMLTPSEAHFVGLLMRMIRAERVVELGTLAGYSAINIAKCLPSQGKLWTIEPHSGFVAVARENVARAELADRVEVVEGRGLEELPTLEQHGPFCAVFVDANKVDYPAYAEWAVANLRSGGLLIGDNAFLFGNLLGDNERAEAMRRFHRVCAEHLDSVCLPTPEGLVVGMKP